MSEPIKKSKPLIFKKIELNTFILSFILTLLVFHMIWSHDRNVKDPYIIHIEQNTFNYSQYDLPSITGKHLSIVNSYHIIIKDLTVNYSYILFTSYKLYIINQVENTEYDLIDEYMPLNDNYEIVLIRCDLLTDRHVIDVNFWQQTWKIIDYIIIE